ncbi:PAS domain S-box protein [Tolypothrix campylonemoides VB511288]|nr:PAS domain S-box protein [Tolypothrix campylonemoides VB511288]
MTTDTRPAIAGPADAAAPEATPPREDGAMRGRLIVYGCDRDLRYTWIVNPAFGLAVHDIVGRRDDELMPGVDASAVMALKRRVLATGVAESAEIELTLAGDPRLYALTAEPVRGADGGIDGLTVGAYEITGLRETERRLRSSETRLALATTATGLGIWDWDVRTGRMVYSARAKAIYGFPPDREPTLQEIAARTHPDDAAATRALRERALDPAVRDPGPYEYRIVRPDGEVRWISAHGEAVFEEVDGRMQAVRYVGTVRDITARRALLDTLREREALLSATFENAGVGMALMDAGGRFTRVNGALCRIAGRSREDLERDGCLRFTHADDVARHHDAVARLRAGEQPVWLEKRYLLPDGSARWVRITLSRVNEALALAVMEDVTERVEAEHALRESEARFRAIADSAPMPMWMSDVGKGGIWFNRPWLELTGRSLQQECGDGWLDGVHPDDRERVLRVCGGAFDAREPFRLDFRLRRADGAWRTVDDVGVPRFAADGRFLGYVGATADVTEQRESEARLRGVFDAQLMGLAIFDVRSGATLAINDCFLQMTGHTREEFDAGLWDWRAFTVPDDLPLDERAIAQAVERGWWDTYEKRYRHRDGRLFPVRISSAPMPGQSGRVVVAVQHIGAERDARDALAESEARLRLGLSAARMVAWDIDLATGQATYSDNGDEILGDGSASEDFQARMPPEDREADLRRIADAIAGRAPSYVSEFRYRHPDGRWMWLHNRGQVEYDAHGTARRFHGVCLDITERKENEDALRRLNAQLESQIEASRRERDRIYELSNDLFAVAGFDGYLKTINPAWSRLLGYTDAELLSRPFTGLVHPDDHADAARVVGALRDGEPLQRFEDRLVGADGSIAWISWAAVPLGDRFYAVGRDITREREREAALRQAQKMEAVGQLTGGIAHDFNNVLGAVMGGFDLIRRKPDDVERVRRWAGHGLAAAERGAKLTGQLLAFSRAQRIELKPLRVDDLLHGMRELLARTLGPMVRLRVEPGAADAGVLSDATQLEMAVLNLAINARDAMSDGGDLRIRTRPVRIDGDAELEAGEYVTIEVSDTGSGMPPDVLARAFDPFFTTKPVGQGTGLGLSQVYGIARQAGGTARVESRAGHGTSVRLLLPRTSLPVQDAGAAPAASPAAAAHRRARVLVVDDDDMRGVLVDALEAMGYAVVAAADGASGLQALERAAPDALIVDFAMPGMTGADVVREVRARHPSLPVLFASGYSDTAAIEAAAGRDARVLRKPFRVDELRLLLDEVLGRGDR